MLPQTPLTVLFDGSCGFCTLIAKTLGQLDRHKRLELVPYQQTGVPARFGLRTEECERSVWAIDAAGRAWHSAAAVNTIISVLTGNSALWWLYERRWVGCIEEKLYRLVARNRSHFPGITPFCERHPEQCGLETERVV